MSQIFKIKTTFFLFLMSFIGLKGGSPSHVDEIVYRYLILHQSKMMGSPLVWQEIKEGHLRTKAIIFSENLFDSLKLGKPHLDIAIRHFQKLSDMRWDAYLSKDYNYSIKKRNHIANYNYFYSSNE